MSNITKRNQFKSVSFNRNQPFGYKHACMHGLLKHMFAWIRHIVRFILKWNNKFASSKKRAAALRKRPSEHEHCNYINFQTICASRHGGFVFWKNIWLFFLTFSLFFCRRNNMGTIKKESTYHVEGFSSQPSFYYHYLSFSVLNYRSLLAHKHHIFYNMRGHWRRQVIL